MRGWPQYGGEGGALLWEKPTMVVVTVQPPPPTSSTEVDFEWLSEWRPGFPGNVRSYSILGMLCYYIGAQKHAQASLHILSTDSYTLLLIPTLIEICVLRLEQTRSTNTSTSTSSYSSTVFLSIAYSPPPSFRPWQFTGSSFSVYSPFICLTSTASPPVAKHWHAAPREVLATHHHVGS